MKEFSTFDVSRIFNIDRTRLQVWLDQAFFTPSKKAKGKGTKAVFTREDLYRLQLFIRVVEHMGSRSLAKVFCSKVKFENVGPEKDQFRYLRYTFPTKSLSGRGDLLKQEAPLNMTEEQPFVVFINLLSIKAEVDRLLVG